MSEEQDQKDQSKLNLGATDPIGARFDQLEKMFAQEDRSKASEDIDQIRSIIQPGSKVYSPSVSVGSFQDNSTQDRRAETRRSSMFFGSSSPFQDPEQAQRQHIQILQADVIYEREKELKVSSL